MNFDFGLEGSGFMSNRKRKESINTLSESEEPSVSMATNGVFGACAKKAFWERIAHGSFVLYHH
jgi:hypothetical protein